MSYTTARPILEHPSLSPDYSIGSSNSCATSLSPDSIGPNPLDPSRGRYFLDSYGRRVLLHGANVSGLNKLPADPNSETHLELGEKFFDGEGISFVGRPWPIDESPKHLARLRNWGFTFLRLVIPWEALEHQGPGEYDSEYFSYLHELISVYLPRYGMKCYIDAHQDVWSRHTGGSGTSSTFAPHSSTRPADAGWRRQDSSSVSLQPPSADPIAADLLAELQSVDKDVEKNTPSPVLDIEHLQVDDDPRLWSERKKNSVLAIVAFTAMGGTITASIYFPALESLQADLNASSSTLALTVSLFILGQGFFPQIWTAISEVSGRKPCYLSALVIYLVATAVASRASTISVFIAMRVLQALGSSAVLALGAGSLADIFDTHERGTKLGIFYSVPLVGPALGPILGGAITTAASWRSAFYFLLGYGAVCFVLMIFMPNTFRKERSLAWRKAMERARHHDREERARAKASLPKFVEPTDPEKAVGREAVTKFVAMHDGERRREDGAQFTNLTKIKTGTIRSGDVKVKIHLRDINPFSASFSVLSSPANFLVLFYSGLLFAAQYTISYTASRSFAADPYDYSALLVGCVLLSFGAGNVFGSVAGGRWSDMVLKKLKAKNGGKGEPEFRIKSTYSAMVLLPPLFVAYAWLVQYSVQIAGPVVILFFLGIVITFVYASTLAYVVDANPGRSTSAVAVNSMFRGVLACISSQVSEDIMNSVGNGAFYTGIAIILALGQLALLVVVGKGRAWREKSQRREERNDERQRVRRQERLKKVSEAT
ncbi:uncharacterized protein JCM6883_005950 [Sporobolomyces salmoneus]|uniref:uncharacterized protein n=1 Tax=Sporobolomyces salmoneus TaxID=183962 RepID=UPI00316EDDA9